MKYKRRTFFLRFLFILFCSLYVGFGYGQWKFGLAKDSLKKVILTLPDDSTKTTNLLWLGDQYKINTPDSAIYFYKQAEEFSRQIHYAEGIVMALNRQAGAGKRTFDETLGLYQQILSACAQYQLEGWRNLTIANIGVLYQERGENDTAVNYYLQVMPYFAKMGESQTLSLAYCNLSNLYMLLKQPGKELLYASKALQVAEKIKDNYSIALACIHYGNALQNKGDMIHAENSFIRAISIARQIHQLELQEKALSQLGGLKVQMFQPDKSLVIYNEALSIADSLKDTGTMSTIQYGIANSLFLKKWYPQAKQQASQALVFAHANKQHETEGKLLMLLSDIAIGLGDFQSSARYRTAYDSIYAFTRSPKLSKDVQELETKYETEKKQREILLQNVALQEKNKEARQQRSWLIIALGGIFLLGLLLFIMNRLYRQKQQLNSTAMQALQAEQEVLKVNAVLTGQLQERRRISQELHDDIGSGLTSILFLSRSVQGNDTSTGKRLTQMAEGLMQKMNEIIWVMNHHQDTLENMVAYMRKQIAEMLDDAGIEYTVAVSDNLPATEIKQDLRRNMYLAAKEAIHNVIRHAGATFVTIRIVITNQLQVIIQDNGKGIARNGSGNFGNGLKNMEERMTQVNGSFEVVNENGTRVVLTAPLTV